MLLREDARRDDLLLIDAGAGDDAASGALAQQLACAFAQARDGVSGLGPHGSVLFLGSGGPEARSGLAALTRTLALEWAPRGLRVNAIFGSSDPDDDLVGLIAGPASRMLTGAIIDAA
jgi:hypothetical protein